MIRKELIDYLSDKRRIQRKELIEKDLMLHSLLKDIESDSYFKENFVFKGGTCLIKCYIGYYRFSEDIDFSWINQKEFRNKSQKEIRRMLSKKIDMVISILNGSADKLGIDFKAEKHNRRYMEFGGGNKFATFKVWYKSVILGVEAFIKIQINFVELFKFPVVSLPAMNIARRLEQKEAQFLFPDADLGPIPVKAYDIREILAEKIRAILTRRGLKARDFVDIFLIIRSENIDVTEMRGVILDKTRFMLKYEKYVQSLEMFNLEKIVVSEEDKLLLKPIEKGFHDFVKDISIFLISLARDIKKTGID